MKLSGSAVLMYESLGNIPVAKGSPGRGGDHGDPHKQLKSNVKRKVPRVEPVSLTAHRALSASDRNGTTVMPLSPVSLRNSDV
jgi:hypothetical protein